MGLPPKCNVLDVGCRDGEICELIRDSLPKANFSGLELSDGIAETTRKKGIDVKICNAEEASFPWEKTASTLSLRGN